MVKDHSDSERSYHGATSRSQYVDLKEGYNHPQECIKTNLDLRCDEGAPW